MCALDEDPDVHLWWRVACWWGGVSCVKDDILWGHLGGGGVSWQMNQF